MDAAPDSQSVPARVCPDCGAPVMTGQRRCTNCGISVDARRRLPRRTPLVAALSVVALSGAAVVVAQAAVTEQAGIDASAPADVASAPVSVAGPAVPPAKKPTSTAPKVEEPAPLETTPQSTTGLSIPSLDADVIQQAQDARDAADEAARNNPDGDPVDDDKAADPDDLQKVKTVKVKRVENYDPDLRPGVEFGEPKAAIDKRTRTVWDVNVPADGQPFGVGIVLDLGSEARRVSEIKISTPTPGFGAVIYRTDAEDLPEKIDDRWTRAAKVREVSDDLTIPVSKDGDAKWTRYILVFLTTPRSADDTRAAISNVEVLP